MESVTTSPKARIFWITRGMHTIAMEFLKRRADKRYSLCDAVSFGLMRQRSMTEALTTDKHFEQEGLRRLLV